VDRLRISECRALHRLRTAMRVCGRYFAMLACPGLLALWLGTWPATAGIVDVFGIAYAQLHNPQVVYLGSGGQVDITAGQSVFSDVFELQVTPDPGWSNVQIQGGYITFNAGDGRFSTVNFGPSTSDTVSAGIPLTYNNPGTYYNSFFYSLTYSEQRPTEVIVGYQPYTYISGYEEQPYFCFDLFSSPPFTCYRQVPIYSTGYTPIYGTQIVTNPDAVVAANSPSILVDVAPVAAVAAVPEVSTWAMLIVGFSLLALIGRSLRPPRGDSLSPRNRIGRVISQIYGYAA
jgi:hypothetical protein